MACFFCPLNSNVKITADGCFGLRSDQAEVFEENYHTQNNKSHSVISQGPYIAIGQMHLC